MKTFTKHATIAMFAGLSLAAIACKKDDPNAQSAANQQGQYPQQQGQYPAQQGQYPQQQGQYPQQQPQGQYPAQTTTPAAAGGTLATPGAMATPCSSDAICLTHKCNVAAGKCAFPCATDFDCASGNRCDPAIAGGTCHP